MKTFLFLWIFFIHWISFNNNQPNKYRWLIHWWPRLSDIPTCRPDDRVRLLTSTMTTQLSATQHNSKQYFLLLVSTNPLLSSKQTFKTWSVHPTWSNLSTWFVISMWSFRHDMIRFIDMIISNTLSNCNSNGDHCKSGGNDYSNRILIRFFTPRYRFPKPVSVIGSTQPFKLWMVQFFILCRHVSWRRHDNTSCTQLYYRLHQATNQFTALLKKSYRIGLINTSSPLYREILQNWRNGSWHIRKIFEYCIWWNRCTI